MITGLRQIFSVIFGCAMEEAGEERFSSGDEPPETIYQQGMLRIRLRFLLIVFALGMMISPG